ncbi:unnamed protein product [Spirodela intermedia]|uniref:Uncharacterized protein n=1 Tax=Spirodela intermedia TaxID=51605 RepID=A0A7I8JW22_SPIIN|nr:unnamed protein product [Spirodela intermedia]CAA7387964.1 unnamed protein product [Spirodela intermedia]
MNDTIQSLHLEFALRNLGPTNYFLGIELIKGTDANILNKMKIINFIPSFTLSSTNSSTITSSGPFFDLSLYCGILGALQYIIISHLDIAFAFFVKHLFRYLKAQLVMVCCYENILAFLLNAFSDVDWASAFEDRRSTSGYLIFLGCNLISWSSKKQMTIALSNTKVEYNALANATVKLIWIYSLLQELGMMLSFSPTFWCDNIRATYLVANLVFHARTKHIDIDFHFFCKLHQISFKSPSYTTKISLLI